MDTHSYKGWLNSDSFLKRAFSIMGYNMVASLIIAIPFYIIFFIVAMTFLAGMSSSRWDFRDNQMYGDDNSQGGMMQSDTFPNPDTTMQPAPGPTGSVNANLKVK